MSERTNINPSDVDLAFLLICESSTSAMSALQRSLHASKDVPAFFEALDDMNIRGPQIWPAFADFCKYDPTTFIAMIMARDEDLVDYVNREAKAANHGEVAVTQGTRAQRQML